DDDLELGRGHREVIQTVVAGGALPVELAQVLTELRVRRRIVERPLHVADAALEVGPDRRINRLSTRELRDAFLHLGAKHLVRLLTACAGYVRDSAGERATEPEVADGGHELALRPVAGGTEYDEDARLARPVFDQPSTERVRLGGARARARR